MKRFWIIALSSLGLLGGYSAFAAPGDPPAAPSKSTAPAAVKPASPAAADEAEPPEIFALERDGKRTPVELNKPLTAEQLAPGKSVVLRVEPFREFRREGVSFNYPREFGYEFKAKNADTSIWVLSGNDCKLMLHRLKNGGQPDEVRHETAERFLAFAAGAKPVDCKLATDDGELKGERVSLTLAGVPIQVEVYAAAAPGGVHLLLLQDKPGPTGLPSDERTRLEKLLHDTLHFSAK